MAKSIIPSPAKKRKGRTPNSECIICGKPLYRRPFELNKIRYVACMEHREEAKLLAGTTKAQRDALTLGRQPGTNNLEGIPKSEESKRKRSISIKKWCKENPDKAKARATKNRGKNHYKWNGGSSKLNQSIRRMTEHRKWMEETKRRDGGACVRCGATEELESHHIKSLAELISELKIKSRDDARRYGNILWNLDNGITLCVKCHYKEHRRKYDDRRKHVQ